MKRLIRKVATIRPKAEDLKPGDSVYYVIDETNGTRVVVTIGDEPSNGRVKILLRGGGTKEVPLSKLRLVIPEFANNTPVTWQKNIQGKDTTLQGTVVETSDDGLKVKVKENKTGQIFDVSVFDLSKAIVQQHTNSNITPLAAVIHSQAFLADNSQPAAFGCPLVFFEGGFEFVNANVSMEKGQKNIALAFYSDLGKRSLDRILRDAWALRWRNSPDTTIIALIDHMIEIFGSQISSEHQAVENFLSCIGLPMDIIKATSPSAVAYKKLDDFLSLPKDEYDKTIDILKSIDYGKFKPLEGMQYSSPKFWETVKDLYNKSILSAKNRDAYWHFIADLIEIQKGTYKLESSGLTPNDFTIRSAKYENSAWACSKF